MSTTSGLTRLYHPSDGALMHSIFALISPWDRSPYALRRVCRSFRAFYAVRVVWTRLLRDHFSAAAAVRSDMTLEEARHLCALALQEPWQELIKGQVLQQFRDSGWSILDLSRTNVTALPHRGHRELEHLTTLRLRLPLPGGFFGASPARALPNPAFPTRTPGVPVPCRAFHVIGGGRFALF